MPVDGVGEEEDGHGYHEDREAVEEALVEEQVVPRSGGFPDDLPDEAREALFGRDVRDPPHEDGEREQDESLGEGDQVGRFKPEAS